MWRELLKSVTLSNWYRSTSTHAARSSLGKGCQCLQSHCFISLVQANPVFPFLPSPLLPTLVQPSSDQLWSSVGGRSAGEGGQMLLAVCLPVFFQLALTALCATLVSDSWRVNAMMSSQYSIWLRSESEPFWMLFPNPQNLALRVWGWSSGHPNITLFIVPSSYVLVAHDGMENGLLSSLDFAYYLIRSQTHWAMLNLRKNLAVEMATLSKINKMVILHPSKLAVWSLADQSLTSLIENSRQRAECKFHVGTYFTILWSFQQCPCKKFNETVAALWRSIGMDHRVVFHISTICYEVVTSSQAVVEHDTWSYLL